MRATQRAVLPPRGELLVPPSAQHLRNLAWECQQLVSATGDVSTRRELLLIAGRFERLAEAREKRRAPARSN